MNSTIKTLAIPGLAGGLLYLILTFVADLLAQLIAPYSIFDVPGMREMNDPVMMLFFLYPFVFAFIAAWIWTIIRGSFPADPVQGGVRYGAVLFLLIVIPNMWVIFTSMTYPTGFYLSNIISGLIAYPVIGYLNARYNQA